MGRGIAFYNLLLKQIIKIYSFGCIFLFLVKKNNYYYYYYNENIFLKGVYIW